MNELTERTMEHFARRWTTYAKAFTATVAVVAVLGGVAQALGLMPVTQRQFEVVAGNTNYLLYLRFHEKAQAGTLTTSERIIYCKVARELGLEGVGCA